MCSSCVLASPCVLDFVPISSLKTGYRLAKGNLRSYNSFWVNLFMEKFVAIAKNESVLLVAAVAAAVSMFFTPPSAAYADYFDLSVLIMLFCLMSVVAGFRRTGLLDLISRRLLARAHNARMLAAVLTGLCFFLSMFVTNDVALLAFVPLSVTLLAGMDDLLISTVVLQTVAANLGSLVTPVGNPQNLFLFSHYGMTLGTFLSLTLPLGGVCLLLLAGMVLLVKNVPMEAHCHDIQSLDRFRALVYTALFLLCLLAVAGLVKDSVCLLILVVCLLMVDAPVFRAVDYSLLLTFVFFFLFVGNLSQLDSVRSFVSGCLEGRVLLASALVSQVISNVPAAVMLASFTNNVKELVLGVDIGGLGTLVASLASLISFRIYSRAAGAHKSRYLAVFAVVNFTLLALLLPVGKLILALS